MLRFVACGCDRGGFKSQQVIKAFGPYLRFHNHACAATYRSVIDGMMHVMGPAAKIMRVHVEQSTFYGFTEQADVKNFEIIGEHRNDVDLHVSMVTDTGGYSGCSAVTWSGMRGERIGKYVRCAREISDEGCEHIMFVMNWAVARVDCAER